MNMGKPFPYSAPGAGLARPGAGLARKPDTSTSPIDALSKRADATHAPQPRYDVTRVGGADHKPLFRAVATFLPEGFSREGLGNSKMEAKRVAAAALLELLDLRQRRPAFFGGAAAPFYEDRAPGEGRREGAVATTGGLRGPAAAAHGFTRAGGRGQGPIGNGMGMMPAMPPRMPPGMPPGMPSGMPAGGLPSGMTPGGLPPGSGMPPGGMLTQGGVPEGGMPQGGMGRGGMQQGRVHQRGMPQGGMPQGGMQQGGMQQRGMQQGGMQQGGLPQGGMPQRGMPQGGVPQRGMPQGGVPQGGVPQGGMAQGGRVMGDPNNINISALPQSLQESIRQYQKLPQQQRAQQQCKQKPESLNELLASMRKNQSFMQHLQNTVGPNPLAMTQEVKQEAKPASHRVDPRDPHNRRQTGANKTIISSQPAPQFKSVATNVTQQPLQPRQQQQKQLPVVKTEQHPVTSAQPNTNRIALDGKATAAAAVAAAPAGIVAPSAAQDQSKATKDEKGVNAGVGGTASPAAARKSAAPAAASPSPSKTGHGSSGMLSKKKRLLASADPAEAPAVPPTLATPAKPVDVSTGDGGGFGEMPGIAIPRKRAKISKSTEAVQSQTRSPALAQPQYPRAQPKAQAQTVQNPPSAQQADRPGAALTAVLFVYIDDPEAMRATVSLAGSPAASKLDLQVRAFGPVRSVLTDADSAVPPWMQVSRAEPSSLDLNVAFAAGRDAHQFDGGGGRIIVVSTSSLLSPLAIPGLLDIVSPSNLDRHLSSLF